MPSNPAPLAEAPSQPETHKVHAALTRTSTGHEDLRELEAGLDSLQSDAVRKHRIDWSRILLPVAALVVLVLVWQFYVSLGVKRRDLVPGPLDVLGQLGVLWGDAKLQEAVWTSLQRGIVGFLISVAIATPVGLLLAQVAPLRRAFGPLISGLQVLPSVAWVPAAIIWFGLTDATVYFVVFMGAIPSTASSPAWTRSRRSTAGWAQSWAQTGSRWPCRSSCPQPCPAIWAGSNRGGRSPGGHSWPPRLSLWAAPSASAWARSWTRAASCRTCRW